MEIKEAIDSFLNKMIVEGKSSHTISTYGYALNNLNRFLTNENIRNVRDIDITKITKFINYPSPNKSTRTKIFKRDVVSSFLNYLVNIGILKENLAKDIKLPKIEKTYKDSLTLEEANILVNKPSNIRDRVILELIYTLSLKISEVSSININDVFLDKSLIRIKGRKGEIRIERLFPETKTLLIKGIVPF